MEYKLVLLSEDENKVIIEYTDSKFKMKLRLQINKTTKNVSMYDQNGQLWLLDDQYRNGAQSIFQFSKNQKYRKLPLHKDFLKRIESTLHLELAVCS